MGTVLGILLFLCLSFKTVYVLPNRGLNNSSENFVPCEEGWYFFREKCYKFGNYASWDQASVHCAEMRGNLASIHSKEQNDFIYTFLVLNMNRFARIGLNDRHQESKFTWVDGSPVDYQNWGDGQPDNFWKNKEEDCVELLSDTFPETAGRWNDAPCDFKKAYICEKDSNKELKSPDPRFCSVEDGGGWKFRDSCLNFVNLKKSWEDAEQYCQNTFNGHLAMILSGAYDEILQHVLPNSKSHIWIGIKTQARFQQMWTTKWPVSYGHFDEPLEEMESGSCILRWNQDMWTTEPCREEHRFVCQKVDPPALTKPAHKSKCPDFPYDWRDIGGEFCYFIEARRKISWFEAQEECIKRGGILATIHSKVEEEVLYPLLKPLERVSIGLSSLSTNGDTFTWSDGSELNYKHWKWNEPSKKQEMCVEIWTSTMVWNDFYCTEVKSFMCQVKKVPDESTSENENVGDEDGKEKDEFMISSPTSNEESISNELKTDTSVSSPTINGEKISNESKMDTDGGAPYKVLFGVTLSVLFLVILLFIVFYYIRLRKKKMDKKSAHSIVHLRSSHEKTVPEKHMSQVNECRIQSIENDYVYID